MGKIKLVAMCLVWGVSSAVSYGQTLPSTVAQAMLKNASKEAAVQSSARASAVQLARLRHLYRLKQKDFDGLDAMLGDYFSLNPKAASARLQQENKKIQKMLVQNWLERDFYAAEHLDPLRKNIRIQAVQGKMEYPRLVPSGARLVLMGEVHQRDWMVNEVEQAVLQLKNAYPDKNIYYASEFVDAAGEGRLYILSGKADVERLVRKRPYYRPMTARLAAAGVRVVGLEDPALSEEFTRMGKNHFRLRQTALGWKTLSASALKNRNTHWARIIRQIYAQDPQALVVVHAGMGHTNYNHAYSLPVLLKEFTPFVTEFSEPGMEDLNTLLERHVPIDDATRQSVLSFKQQNPRRPVYVIRQLKSKRAALTTGCDLHIKKIF